MSWPLGDIPIASNEERYFSCIPSGEGLLFNIDTTGDYFGNTPYIENILISDSMHNLIQNSNLSMNILGDGDDGGGTIPFCKKYPNALKCRKQFPEGPPIRQ